MMNVRVSETSAKQFFHSRNEGTERLETQK